MLRGYRLYFAALGLALSCANHAYAESDKQQSEAEQSIAKSLGDIAASNNQQTKRAKRADQDEAPCGQGQYGSNADLCAQWKAADAASDSAWWAWAGAIIGLASLVGVFVALGLALHSNWIARDSARREHRAYVSLTLDKKRIFQLEFGKPFIVVLEVLNYGLTPAINGGFQFACGIVENDWEWSAEHVAKRDTDVKGVLHRDTPLSVSMKTPFPITEDQIAAIKDGTSRWVGRGFYFYDDIFGYERLTQISLVLTAEDLERDSITLAREGHIAT